MATEDEGADISTLNDESDVEENSPSPSTESEELPDNVARFEETTNTEPEAPGISEKDVKVKESANDINGNVRNGRKSIGSKDLSFDTRKKSSISSPGTVPRQSVATRQTVLSRTSRALPTPDGVEKVKTKKSDLENTKEQRIIQLHNERKSELTRRKKADKQRLLSDDERAMKDIDYQNSLNELGADPLCYCANESKEHKKDLELKPPGDEEVKRKGDISRLHQRNKAYRYGIPKAKPSPSRDTKLLQRVEGNRGETTWEPQQTEPKTNKERRSRPNIDNVFEKLMKKK